MTVEEAINELDALTMREFSEKTKAAIRKGVSILEKLEKKEPAPQEAETSSKSNTSIKDDNTKLKACQEVIEVVATALIEYYQNHLSKEEQKAWDLGEVYRKVLDAQNLLEEEKQCQ